MIHMVPGGACEAGFVWFVLEKISGVVKEMYCSQGAYKSFEGCLVAGRVYLDTLTDIPDCAVRELVVLKLQ